MSTPQLVRYHRLVLFPVGGLLVVGAARGRAGDPRVAAELDAAFRCQLGGAAVWGLHGVLQLAIAATWWFMDRSQHLDPQLRQAGDSMLWLATAANVLMWGIEWGLVVIAGLRAAAGHPYPLSRRERRAAPGDAEPAPPDDWEPLDRG